MNEDIIINELEVGKYEYSYRYALNIIKGPWKKGEDIISKYPEFSYQYARDVIKRPWPKAK